jgi:hypothetical protein
MRGKPVPASTWSPPHQKNFMPARHETGERPPPGEMRLMEEVDVKILMDAVNLRNFINSSPPVFNSSPIVNAVLEACKRGA